MLPWLLVAAGLGVVLVRRRTVAVALVTAQALALAGLAIRDAAGANDLVAAGALALRALVLALLFSFLVSRTPVRAGLAPLMRGAVAVALALVLTWLVPHVGLDSRNVERAVLALVAFGIAAVATRRATLFQVLGIVLVENGLGLAALRLAGGASTAIELGVALDLTLIAFVAGVFHEAIFAEFGTGDASLLRALRD
jgi:hydrogenase-4 membrane subunit HyfE